MSIASPDRSAPPLDPSAVAQTTAQLRAAHHQEAGELQHAIDRLTAVVGWPGFVVLLALAIVAWMALNLALTWFGDKAPDATAVLEAIKEPSDDTARPILRE